MKNRPNPSALVVPSYTDLKPGSSKVNMDLRNPTSRRITMKAKWIVAWIAAANIVPPILSQKNSQESEEWIDKKWNPPICILK